MLDLLLIATMFVVCGGIGAPIAELVPTRFQWRMLLAPTLGYAVLSVAAPIAYRWGLSIPAFMIASAVLGIGLGVWRLRARRDSFDRRFAVLAIGTVVGATLVLLAPRFVGGDQFAVFQGNQWDTFGYLQSAIVFANEP